MLIFQERESETGGYDISGAIGQTVGKATIREERILTWREVFKMETKNLNGWEG